MSESDLSARKPNPGVTVLLALLPAPSDAESAVNNLTEQGIAERRISVLTNNPADARAIIDDGGPLKDVTGQSLPQELQALGLPSSDAESYDQGVSAGKALVAVACPPGALDAVRATLQGYNPSQIGTLPEGPR